MKRTTIWNEAIRFLAGGVLLLAVGCGQSEAPAKTKADTQPRPKSEIVSAIKKVDPGKLSEDVKKLIDESKTKLDDLNTRMSLFNEKRKAVSAEINQEIDKVITKLEDKQIMASKRMEETKSGQNANQAVAAQNLKLAIMEFEELVKTCEALIEKTKP